MQWVMGIIVVICVIGGLYWLVAYSFDVLIWTLVISSICALGYHYYLSVKYPDRFPRDYETIVEEPSKTDPAVTTKTKAKRPKAILAFAWGLGVYLLLGTYVAYNRHNIEDAKQAVIQARQDKADAAAAAKQAKDDAAAAAQQAKDDAAAAAKQAKADAAAAAKAKQDRADALAAEPRVSADDLAATYDDNEVAGNNGYDQKTFVVSGTVDQVSTGLGELDVYLSTSSAKYTKIDCEFSNDQSSNVGKIHTGDVISIEGTGAGLIGGNVQMNDCDIVDQ